MKKTIIKMVIFDQNFKNYLCLNKKISFIKFSYKFN